MDPATYGYDLLTTIIRVYFQGKNKHYVINNASESKVLRASHLVIHCAVL